MGLRDIKKEVHELENVNESLNEFRSSWIKPLRDNTNKNLPFLKDIPLDAKKDINQRLTELRKNFQVIKISQRINEKLKNYSRNLIDLKITTFNNDKRKSKYITNMLINDDYYSLSSTIHEINQLYDTVKDLNLKYDEINNILLNNLPLDDKAIFLELPHYTKLKKLEYISKKQKRIVKDLGNEFISLAREINSKQNEDMYFF